MKQIFTATLCLLLLGIISCKKSSTSSPYEVRTYNDGYQFGAIVDGVEFIPKSDFSPFSPKLINASLLGYSNTTEVDWHMLIYLFKDSDGNQKEIYATIKNFKGVGKYSMQTITNPGNYRPENYGSWTVSPKVAGATNDFYITNPNDTGYIECTRYDASGKEFYFNYTCRSVYFTSNIKKIEGILKY